jgi:hypothetical protein
VEESEGKIPICVPNRGKNAIAPTFLIYFFGKYMIISKLSKINLPPQ